MDNQITLTGFSSPNQEELDFLGTIEDAMRHSAATQGSLEELVRIEPNQTYTTVFFYNLTAFRLKLQGNHRYISIPRIFRNLIPADYPVKETASDPKYVRVTIDSAHPVESYAPFLILLVGECVNRYPKGWSCCSRYEACSDAKVCVHPEKIFALECGYRRVLNSGRIFYGKNRNID